MGLIDMSGWIMKEHGVPESRLTVIERASNNKEGRAMWKCRCECGNEIIALGKHLRSGNTKSCGCLQRERTAQSNMNRVGSLVGQRFGKLQVISESGFITHPNGKRSRIYKCLCDCGNYCEIQHQYLAYGDTTSCGCIRSKQEFIAKNYLKQNNYNFKTEYTFNDLLDINELRFDFAIFNQGNKLLCLIEIQGEQHTNRNNGYYSEDIVRHDKMKYNYCFERKIPLYYITYKENTEEKLKEILNELYS